MSSEPIGASSSEPSQIGGRYVVLGALGRGGMATVHRVSDRVLGREVALKRLLPAAVEKEKRHLGAMFEREFHILSSLSHPSIIQVHDYGVDDGGAYYTMELLEDGDLRERSPVPWREACAMLYDVCSSLALIHSRRLVHRDVSPRNIRCTSDGRAKLIDFGAMVPMGHDELIVGTPAFVAPEVLHISGLDARTDLFSFGATLYFALTGRSAFPARSFAELFEVWQRPPLAPSRWAPEIPEGLDALVLSLLSLEPAMRPRTAFEVMQRLAAMTGIERVESASVSRAYLSTPVLVGRDSVMQELRRETKQALAGRGRSVIIEAKAGLGRTRVLDQAVFEAKAAGATVLRSRATFATASGASMLEAFGDQVMLALPDAALKLATASDFYTTLFEIDDAAEHPGGDDASHLPRLKRIPRDAADAAKHQAALLRWLLEVGRKHPLIVAVDDAHRLGEVSAATLAAFAGEAQGRRLLVLVTAEAGAIPTAPPAFHSLESGSTKVPLEVLRKEDTEALLTSLFGDVPNVGILCHTIHGISGGNPRACLDLAQHLVDTAAVQYSGGTWSLPSRLDASDLPETAEAAIRTRIAGLSAPARATAQSQALAFQRAFTREDYIALCRGRGSSDADSIITELVEHQVLASDGRFYTLAHLGWVSSLTESLEETEKIDRHRALAALYESRPGLESVFHMLAGGEEARGLSRLLDLVATIQNSTELRETFQLDAGDAAMTFARALGAAVALGRPPREVNTLRRWLASIAVASDESFYWQSAPAWLEQLKLDSGHAAWEALGDVADPAERRGRALSQASARYAALPEAERVYRLDEAIRLLVHYVAISIAIGSRTQDVLLISSLPGLLEPFAPLSPGVDAILHNAMATREARVYSQPERARKRWIEVHERLGKMTPDQVESLHVIRQAIASGIGAVEAQMGLPSAMNWAGLLERDELQRVHALYLRKVVRLQQGDWDGAESYRRKAEKLEISARARQMFTSSLVIECAAHSMASDLTGLKQVIDRIEPLARKFPGWVPYHHVALGRFEQIRGNLEAARREYEAALERAVPDGADPSRAIPAFPPASAGLIETLTALGAHAEALEMGEKALALCAELGIGVCAHEIVRATALADARLGNFERAASRVDRVIEEQLALGVSGLNLGASYEARARVAIWAGDADAVANYARGAAREYRHGAGSPLGARYERLMEEAAKGGSGPLPDLADFDAGTSRSLGTGSRSHDALVTHAMMGAGETRARGQRALRLLCDERKSDGGHLYLFAEEGLRLVASVGDDAEPDGLLAFLAKRFEENPEEFVTMTVVAVAPPVSPADESSVFTDATGVVHDPVLLSCVLEGKALHAGVAVLSHRALPGRAAVSALASAVSAHLIRAGDTVGVPA